MHIVWEEKSPLRTWLPRRHPAHGLLSGQTDLLPGGTFFSTTEVTTLPPPRHITPALLRDLEDYHRELDAPPAALESLRLLAEGAQAVVTGQQSGLLGGPMYTLLKALSAIHLARELSQRWKRPFVPLFWSEAEDHDFEEMNRTFTLGRDHQITRFELPWPDEYRQSPAGALPLGPESDKLLQSFFEASGHTEYTPDLLRSLRGDLETNPTFSLWFSRQMLRLLGPLGLVIFDSLDARLKTHSRPLWAQILEEPLRLTNECRREGRELLRKGFRPVLEKMERRCPFFLISDRQRLGVVFERQRFKVGKKEYTLLELRRRLDGHPEDFSPGVNLRPLLQDYLLPTAVYVCGPTELAYFAQILPGYRWLQIPPPALVLRASLTLVETTVRKTLKRYRITPQDLRTGITSALNALIRREHRMAAPARWEKLRSGTLRPLDRFLTEVGATDAELARLSGQTRGKIEFLIKDLEARSVASLRKRSEVGRDQLRRSQQRLFPRGELQERILSPYYFLNKYGPGFLTALAEDLPADFTQHHFGNIIV